MRNSPETLCKAVVFSLIGALLASGPAQAEPRPYSKTLTFTLSTTNPAPPAARRPYYAPGLTKYSSVKLPRAGTQVAVESLEIAHDGLQASKRNSVRPEAITITHERLERVTR